VHLTPPLLSTSRPVRRRPTRLRLRLWLSRLAWALTVPCGAALASPAPELPAQLLQAVNGYRQQQGLSGLQHDAALTALASEHSAAMAAQHQLSHDGFNRRFERSGRRLCVENLAFNHHRADALLAAWQRSPDHHANLLEARVQQVGIAVVDGYLTLLACTPPER
jgi:uncharacterized protein YkwD